MRKTTLWLLTVMLFASCDVNNIKNDTSLKPLFEKYQVKGCFAMFDNAQGQFTLYDSGYYRKQFAPAGTFGIVSALVGLETGRIFDEKTVLPWDGVERPLAAWNRDMNMEDAFRENAVPYFQEAVRRIGRDTLQYWVDTLGYGNKKLLGALDSCWLNDTLKVSPDEQLGLVKRLYFGQLPFQKRTQEIVKKVMAKEINSLYKLSYLTGATQLPGGKQQGWVVGWIEENRHPYFFVLFTEATSPADATMSANEALLKDILSHYTFMQGKK